MTENNNPSIETKKISALLGIKFYIPDYQRGYRWTKLQVETLLSDINEFDDKNGSRWYCLQPIVVSKNENDNYVVLDGQQRLTTIYIIIKYLENKNLYSLSYQTRAKSVNFLENLAKTNDEVYDNIDFYHIQKVYNTISKWFNFQNSHVDETIFKEKLLKHTRVIWYEVKTDEPIKVFKRLNSGKIRLTNAELIRALFLSKENKNSLYDENQLLIASEWDTIENKLNNESFWYFFNKKNPTDYATKIDRLFEIYYDLQHDSSKEKDEFEIFNYFYTSMKDKSIKNHWDEIKYLFDTIEEWYTNHELYHLIGFCLHSKHSAKSIDGILGMWKNSTRKFDFENNIEQKEAIGKSGFRSKLDRVIKKIIGNIQLNELRYNENNNIIHAVLLLHNILTIMNKTDKAERFSFHLYAVSKNWSLEHIHAQNEEEIPENHYKEWLQAYKPVIDDENIKERIDNFLESEKNKDEFNKLYNEIMEKMKGEETVHGIENMALLTGSANASLNDAVFPVKRYRILELEKNGAYIPICTRYVFLKAYNPTSKDFMVWNQSDREAYYKDICRTLKDYLTPQENCKKDCEEEGK